MLRYLSRFTHRRDWDRLWFHLRFGHYNTMTLVSYEDRKAAIAFAMVRTGQTL